MPRSALLLLALLVLGGGLFAVFELLGAEEPVADGASAVVEPGRPTLRDVAELPAGRAMDEPAAAVVEDATREVRSLADDLPPIEGRFGPTVPREGRTATLLPVVRRDGVPVNAEITVVAGPDEGLRVTVAATESPEPVEVFPGFAILEVRPAGGGLCRREWLLDHRRTHTLDLDFVTRGIVDGHVTDTEGQPVAGALVSLDGVETRTNYDGNFRCELLVSGQPLLHVVAPGFVAHRESLPETVATEPGPRDVVLKRGTSLTVSVAGVPGSQPVTLQLLPTGGPLSSAGGRMQSLYPWELINPVQVQPGGRVTFEDLPPCKLEVFAFHGLGTAGPEVAFLIEGQQGGELALTLDPLDLLTGRVVEQGKPVAGAGVRLAYANPMRATHRRLGKHAEHTRRLPVRVLAHVEQEVFTDADGRFALGIDPEVGKPPYVTVFAPDGKLSITRKVDDTRSGLLFDLGKPGS